MDRATPARLAAPMFCGALAALQAPMLDGLSLDPFTLFDDGWAPVDAGGMGRSFCNLDDVNAQLIDWLDAVTHVRIHYTTQRIIAEPSPPSSPSRTMQIPF